jgi:hypothetical protein
MHMRVAFVVAVCGGCVVGAATNPSRAGMPTPYGASQVPHKVVVPKLEAPAELHTDLERFPWTRAARVTGNLDWRRIRNANAPIWTYLFYDDQALWVACRHEQVPGAKLKCEAKERDANLRHDDNFEFWLDVGRTGRTYYKFFTNPAGVLYDAFLVDASYNSNTTVKTAIDERGWTAALRIPFADLPGAAPAVGAVWAFNAATRTGTDSSWAPVLGGYHIPEEFAQLVFGGANVRPVRLQTLDSLRIGPNRLALEAPSGARYAIEVIDVDDRVMWRDEGALEGGRLDFNLGTDRIHHVNFTFTDANGNELLTFWRPFDSPRLLAKLDALRAEADELDENLAYLPDAARAEAETLLQETRQFLDQPILDKAKEWDRLDRESVALRRRLRDADLLAETRRRVDPDATFAVALATPMDKVMIRDFPCEGYVEDHYDLALARNEAEGMQVVVIPLLSDLRDVSVAVSAPRGAAGGGSFDGEASVGLVGHVKTSFSGSNLPEYVGWYPDPILDFQQRCDAAVGEHVAFWVNVAAGKGAAPGDYQSTLTVTARDHAPVAIKLNIRVWDFELLDGTHLGNAFTYAEPYTRKLYGDRWSKELAYKYYDFILDHRLNINNLYGKEERDIEMLKHGAERGMRAFNLFYVGKGTAVARIREMLDERMPALKKAGLDRLAYVYGFDEVNDDVFPKIRERFGTIHERYPELKRMTTGYDTTYGKETDLRDYVDIWVPLVPRYDMAAAKELRAEGKDMWWYICVGPRHPFPNLFVESPAIEARLLMGAMSYKYQSGGVLYFMTNLWKLNDHPIRSGPYTDWFPGIGRSRESVYANGDGSTFCAGPDGPVTTIRYENIRDGLEDYEYLYKLAEVVEAVRRQPATLETIDFVARAGDLLSVPDGVVQSSARYTYDPGELYALRTQVAEAILEGTRLAGTAGGREKP